MAGRCPDAAVEVPVPVLDIARWKDTFELQYFAPKIVKHTYGAGSSGKVGDDLSDLVIGQAMWKRFALGHQHLLDPEIDVHVADERIIHIHLNALLDINLITGLN
jgi:hypothetical protein